MESFAQVIMKCFVEVMVEQLVELTLDCSVVLVYAHF